MRLFKAAKKLLGDYVQNLEQIKGNKREYTQKIDRLRGMVDRAGNRLVLAEEFLSCFALSEAVEGQNSTYIGRQGESYSDVFRKAVSRDVKRIGVAVVLVDRLTKQSKESFEKMEYLKILKEGRMPTENFLGILQGDMKDADCPSNKEDDPSLSVPSVEKSYCYVVPLKYLVRKWDGLNLQTDLRKTERESFKRLEGEVLCEFWNSVHKLSDYTPPGTKGGGTDPGQGTGVPSSQGEKGSWRGLSPAGA